MKNKVKTAKMKEKLIFFAKKFGSFISFDYFCSIKHKKKVMDIRTIVKRQGWTMDRIAEKMGKTQSNVSQIISNPSPTLNKLREIAGIIGCEWWEFFLDEIDPVKLQQARGDMAPALGGHSAALLCPHCGGAFAIDVRPVGMKPAQQQQEVCTEGQQEQKGEAQ